ncbi:methyltransferase domain-containing protein [Actinoalloteichus hymeniacidonis]|uniref:Protein-L-isoaspartate O-methyltransferase n=1 Tax=Actinoalloteichus hymeniacidonis TaxID=340345 RepID=A0AAC9HUC7_9PSEU|nr:methyltransferase domain-containing protein [Actinoalloteichus hymeniacidonis]AOS65603.1 protein-L-isoaspartate carboxylmethyltransferase [Actinoalloteichus hymeniacidonis]MBB5906307.1 protein-L-isoaspartate O-methyltransferase [Actinoalloteichus hymeniacidonis]
MTAPNALEDPSALRQQFITGLIESGAIPNPQWQEAFRTVARHRFVTRFTASGTRTAFDLADPTQRSAALKACYSNETLLTQQDAGGSYTSSSTEVTLMALMLDQLDARPGHSVLEIGTGTGYNAALLCHVLGNAAVASVDIDPTLIDAARRALESTGYRPTVVCDDGAMGIPAHAPFDRIIATCGVLRIPPAWPAQLKPNGVIVVNVGIGLARLVRGDDGGVVGPFIGEAAFMRLRHNVSERAITTRELVAATSSDTSAPTTRDFPAALATRTFQVIAAWVLPSVEWVTILDPRVHIFVDPETASWVRASPIDGDRAAVIEHGPRRLWSELGMLAARWERAGRPSPTRFGLSVTADGDHRLWLDRADAVFCELG